MHLVNALVVIVACVVLFLFAIQKFSHQMEYVVGARLKRWLRTFTLTPGRGIVSGVFATAALQSSTAVTVILVGLVNAGLIPFTHSLGVIFGANIGTTFSTQLIAWNGLYLAPYIMIIGFLLYLVPNRFRRYGKPVMYFGLIFFSFLIISILIGPLQHDPILLKILSYAQNLSWALLIGAALTALFQASAVVAGLVVVLVGQNLLTFEAALGIILGSNIGTTFTALLASLFLSTAARRVAVAHLLFNLIGVALILPFLPQFTELVQLFDGNVARQVANAHLIFNLLSAVVFLLFLKPFAGLVIKLVK